jgi:hypothetical protein
MRQFTATNNVLLQEKHSGAHFQEVVLQAFTNYSSMGMFLLKRSLPPESAGSFGLSI